MSKPKPIPATRLLLAGARVVDPLSRLDAAADIFIADGTIQKIGPFGNDTAGIQVVDCSGKTVIPGLLDMHVHLREPGREDEETVETGCLAAAAGGFTEIACMPNTNPPLDSRSQVEFILERAAAGPVGVHPVACITRGQAGEELTEMSELVGAGVVGFSDDGKPIEKASVLRRALEYAGMFGKPIIEHCEDRTLSENGVMHEGWTSTRLGMRGIPSISEEVAVARDLTVAEYTQGPLHIAHVSTEGSVRLIREAKARGVRVTAETCPHYLVLTDEAVLDFDTNTKMNPPLRTEKDRLALIDGLRDGTLDAISTDHAPHAAQEKETEFDAAPFGIIGLETAVGLALSKLVRTRALTLENLIDKLSVQPRKIFRLPEIRIREGAPANLTVLDTECRWKVDVNGFESKSRNSPFHGWELIGKSVGIVHRRTFFRNWGG
jgi:dihydroorotase